MNYIKTGICLIVLTIIMIIYFSYNRIYEFKFCPVDSGIPQIQNLNASNSSACFKLAIFQPLLVPYFSNITSMKDGDYIYVDFNTIYPGASVTIKTQLSSINQEIHHKHVSEALSMETTGSFCMNYVFRKGQENRKMAYHDASCFYPVKVLNSERKLIHNVLKLIRDEFEKQNLLLMLFYGSYLGSKRFQSTLPYDDDMDFLFLEKDKEKVRKLFQKLAGNKTNGFIFDDKIREHWKLGFMCRSLKVGSCKIEIDFFRTFQTKKNEFYTTWTWGRRKFDYYLLYPNLWRPYHGVMFRAPRNFTTFVHQTYGDSDQTCAFVPPHKNARSGVCKITKIDCKLLRYKYSYTLSDDNVFVSSVDPKSIKITVELLIQQNKVLSVFIYAVNSIYQQKWENNQITKHTTTKSARIRTTTKSPRKVSKPATTKIKRRTTLHQRRTTKRPHKTTHVS